MRLRRLFIFYTLFYVPAALIANEPTKDQVQEIRQLFLAEIEKGSPGCAVGVVYRGELVYGEGFGLANLEHNVPNATNSMFEIGSFSKTFTTASVALLMDQGKISSEDELHKFVPEMHRFDPPIRIKHLLRCQTGLYAQYHIMPLAGFDNLPTAIPFTREDALTVITGQKHLPFDPGTGFRYGSTDYFLLGEIVRRLSGQPFEEFASQQIFKPIGMENTVVESDPGTNVPHRATCYIRRPSGEWRSWRNQSYFAGGSAVLTSVEDLVKWEQNFRKSRLPAGKQIETFLKSGELLGNRRMLTLRPQPNYRGLGQFSGTGGVFGASACFMRFPDQEYAFICLTNREDIAPWSKCEQMAEILLGDKMSPPKDPGEEKLLQEKLLHSAQVVTLPRNSLKSFVGAYQFHNGLTVWNIALKGTELFLVDHLKNDRGLEPIELQTFRSLPATETGNSPGKALLQFESLPSEKWQLKFTPEGGTPVILNRVESLAPTSKQLQEYAGIFDSPEIGTTYKFRVLKNRLQLRVGGRRWEDLDASTEDLFIPKKRTPHDQRFFQFMRDNQGRIQSLKVSFWRVKNLHFDRRPESLSPQ